MGGQNTLAVHPAPYVPAPLSVQDGRAHVQDHSWNCAVIPESTAGLCRRSAWSASPPALLGPIICWCRPLNFPVAGPTIWNSRPDKDSVISAPSLSTFHQRLKTFLFQASFLTLSSIPVNYSPPPVDPEVILLLGPL